MMNDRRYLVVREALRLLGAIILYIPTYFILENGTIGIALTTIAMLAMIIFSVRKTYQDYHNRQLEFIYNGFSLKGQIVPLVLLIGLSTLLFVNGKYHFFTSVGFVLLVMTLGLQLIVFDFEKKNVTGLFEGEIQSFDQLQVEHIKDNNSPKIKITDKTGFFVMNSSDFAVVNWERLLQNLQKLQTSSVNQK